MGVVFGFLPFLVFAVLSSVIGATYALIAGAAVSVALIARGWRNGASFKLLECGTFVLFVAVSVYSATAGNSLSIAGVRLCVDGGLLAVVMITMAARRPFTLDYAKEQVAREYWNRPAFIHANYVITAGWAVAFLVMVVADAVLLLLPDVPRAVGIVAIAAAMFGAVAFTRRYAAMSRAAAQRVANTLPG